MGTTADGKRRGTVRRGARTPEGAGPAGIAVLAACALLGACSLAFQPPEVRIAEVRLASLGLTQGTAELELEVVNRNRRSLDVQGVRYHLQVRDDLEEPQEGRWVTLGEGFHSEAVALQGGDTTFVTVDVPFRYRAVGAAIRSLLRRGEVDYRLDGEVEVAGPLGPARVPIRTEGSLGP